MTISELQGTKCRVQAYDNREAYVMCANTTRSDLKASRASIIHIYTFLARNSVQLLNTDNNVFNK